MCGDGSKGQLGIGECESVFSLTLIRDQKVKLVACGESHTVIMSQRSSDSQYSVKTSGSNDKYQLGVVGMKRDFLQKYFIEVPALKSKSITDISCWNFTACLDDKHNLFVWGALVSTTSTSHKPTALCIKQPEQVSSLKVSSIQIGHSLAFAIEHKTQRPFVIGTN